MSRAGGAEKGTSTADGCAKRRETMNRFEIDRLDRGEIAPAPVLLQQIKKGDKVVMWYVSGNRNASIILRWSGNPSGCIPALSKAMRHFRSG
jgi:hypothetical protein